MTTKVKLVGFNLKFSNGISVDDFYHHLVMYDAKPQKIGAYTYELLTDIHKDYIVGTLICYKGDKKFVVTENAKSDEVLEQHPINRIELTPEQKNTQVTIFCLVPSSLSGMFYSYVGGVPINILGTFLKKVHDSAKKLYLDQYTEELSQASNKSKKICREEAEKKYSGQFTLDVMVKLLDVNNIVDSFSSISSLDLTISPTTPPPASGIFRSISNISDRMKVKATISKNSSSATNTSNAKEKIKAILNGSDAKTIEALRIYGKSLTGAHLDASLGDNMEHFGQLTLDDFIETLPKDYWESYTSSEALKKLVMIMESDLRRFPKPTPYTTWKKSQDKKLNY